MVSESPSMPAGSYAERLIGILVAIADGPDVLSIKALSERLGLAPSSIHRVLAPLVSAGLIDRAPQRRYQIGTEFFRIAACVESRFLVSSAAKPIMQKIVNRTGESCLLGILNRSQKSIVMAHAVEGRLPLNDLDGVLANASPLRSGLGHAIMAWLDDNEVRVMLATVRDAAVDLAILRQEFSIIQRQGIAASTRSCSGVKACELAAPFFDESGKVRGSIGVILPKFHIGPRGKEIASIVRDEANNLSKDLGYKARKADFRWGTSAVSDVWQRAAS